MAPRRGIRLDIRYVRSVVMIEIRPVSLPDGSDQFSRQILSKFQTYLGSLGKCARRAPPKIDHIEQLGDFIVSNSQTL